MVVGEGEQAWLVNAAYEDGTVTLTLVRSKDHRPVNWTDSKFHPYYLTENEDAPKESRVSKFDLFLERERTLSKIRHSASSLKKPKGWEADISPTLSYTYDNRLRFGLLHEYHDGRWIPRTQLTEPDEAHFKELLEKIGNIDSLKQSILSDSYAVCMQPVPKLLPKTVGLPEAEWSEEEYHRAILLSRLTNLPLRVTYQKYAVSEWIRGMLHNYYRSHGILIPTNEELRLGSEKKYVTGALTITPASGTYFDMIVLDFESLYPGVTDRYNLSYETIRCPHQECKDNLVPGLDYHVCRKTRGIYSAILGALRELRIHHFKPLTRKLPGESAEGRIARGASQALKLLLNASYGVTVRIRGLASPLLGEAITAYGRYVLQSTFDMAKAEDLKPKYGDTDSIFLDKPDEDAVGKFIGEVKEKFRLELAYDRKYSVCVLSNAMKAYFGILPDGEAEIKGLTVAKSNSPRFFLNTFQECLKVLAEGRTSREDFERAKNRVPSIVSKALQDLAKGVVPLEDLEYKVELRDDPRLKMAARSIPQAYQAAILLMEKGDKVRRGMEIGFVKVHPYKHQGHNFSVKPFSQANITELNVEDYVRNMMSSLQQTFDPMGVKLEARREVGLSEFN